MSTEQKNISVSVQMTTGDMFDFLYWHSYHGVMGIVNYGFSLAALVALLCGFGEGNLMATVALLVLAALFTVINPLLLLQKADKQVKNTPMFQKPLQYTFDEKGFTVTQETESASAAWTDVLQIRETKKTMVLYLGAANATVLPKKACDGNLEEIKKYIRNAAPEAAKKLK